MRIRNTKIDLAVVAATLNDAKRPHQSRVTYQGGAFDLAVAALFSAIELPDVSDSGRQRIIRDALFSFRPEERITKGTLLSAVARHESIYIAAPSERYVLLTTISAKFISSLHAINDGANRIRFHRNRPHRFTRRRFQDIRTYPREPEATGHTWVTVSVRARSTFEAVDQAFAQLDFIRGMWNFTLTRHTISRSVSFPTPLGDIGLGRIHTIHRPSGAGVGDTFWFQPAFFPQQATDLGRDWRRIESETITLRRQIARAPYSDILRNIFVRYARALDGVDFDSSYLKLWSLFELLTGSANAQYDRSIRRALFLFEQQPVNRAILEHLREYRNATVHTGASTDLVHDFCWQLKQYVDELIRFHVTWIGRFESWPEATEFLDLPLESQHLKKRIIRARQALKYRGG